MGPQADNAPASIAVLSRTGETLRDGSAVLPIYSLTKPFIAACVVASGIDLNQRVDRWFDATWLPRAGDISVAQLLSHTSGIQDYFAAGPDYAEAISNGESPWIDDVFADHTLRQPLLFEPGQGFMYSNPGYWLLGQILQREANRSIMEVINSRIATPLELSSLRWASGQFATDLPDYPAEWVWHGLLLASANDVARFMASDLVTPLRDTLYRVPIEHPIWRDPHYGYGLMLEPGDRFGHNGEGPGFSAACYHFEATGHTACVLLRSVHEESAMRQLLALPELQESTSKA